MTTPDFYALVAQLRAKQIQFFSTRDNVARAGVLRECKKLEKDVDAAIAARQGVIEGADVPRIELQRVT